jgi:hypothetical protein
LVEDQTALRLIIHQRPSRSPNPIMEDRMNDPQYTALAAALQAAYEQSAAGKGKERHANGKPFDRQPIMEIGRMVGPGYQIGQAMKKGQEAMGMLSRNEHARARAELLGAIVYMAAAWNLMNELEEG